MKTLLLLLIPFSLIAQRRVQIEKWEIHTVNQGLVIGASLTESEAIKTIEDFKNRNKGKKYEAKYEQVLPQTVTVKKRGDDPLQELMESILPNKKYFVLTPKAVELFQKYNWMYHPELVMEYETITKKGFSDSQKTVRVILRYKIKGFTRLVDSY